MQGNFFIRDCNENIVGNPKGYATMRGAIAQQNRPGSPAYRAIWAAYDERMAGYALAGVPVEERRRNISSIRLATDIEN